MRDSAGLCLCRAGSHVVRNHGREQRLAKGVHVEILLEVSGVASYEHSVFTLDRSRRVEEGVPVPHYDLIDHRTVREGITEEASLVEPAGPREEGLGRKFLLFRTVRSRRERCR